MSDPVSPELRAQRAETILKGSPAIAKAAAFFLPLGPMSSMNRYLVTLKVDDRIEGAFAAPDFEAAAKAVDSMENGPQARVIVYDLDTLCTYEADRRTVAFNFCDTDEDSEEEPLRRRIRVDPVDLSSALPAPYRVATHEQVATILHALRSVQMNQTLELPDACGKDDGSCDHFDDARRLTIDEIDELCESINIDGLAILN